VAMRCAEQPSRTTYTNDVSPPIFTRWWRIIEFIRHKCGPITIQPTYSGTDKYTEHNMPSLQARLFLIKQHRPQDHLGITSRPDFTRMPLKQCRHIPGGVDSRLSHRIPTAEFFPGYLRKVSMGLNHRSSQAAMEQPCSATTLCYRASYGIRNKAKLTPSPPPAATWGLLSSSQLSFCRRTSPVLLLFLPSFF